MVTSSFPSRSYRRSKTSWKRLTEEASDKVLEVEQKYNEIRKPVYDNRNEIIKSIPDFWLTAFLSHPALCDLLNEEDQKIFKYLSSLEVEDSKDVKSGYSITFNFNPNPYFEDTKLTKAFTFLDEGTTKITATSIKWKEGKGIPNGVNHEKKGNKRPLAEESFFSWFSETQQKEIDEIHDEVAEIIKEDLWPNPLTYFNNEADEEDFDGDEDDEEGKDDDGSEDDDDDQDDDDDDEDGSSFNVYPRNPPELQEVMDEMFSHLTKTGLLIENILNKCLSLPPNFLKEYNHDRSCDFMAALRYFPATDTENNGILEHEDGNCITFVLQDEAGGLEVRKNGEWIPVTPAEGTLVVNICDVIQVLSNNRFQSATHRVVRPEGRSRYSFAFFYNLQGDKWVEPLPQFTKEIGEPPKYRGFLYKEYQQLRMRNKTHPPSRPEDVIHITHYAIPTSIS
ncbi:hypothetical protein L1049_027438 [Liquidambar formosana]|uniref:Fe2OG dioxygenase domain-containing protein n=1 Tax=Liquidambar formosana TaxID=63359 RepID=A0AAP0RH99_LIQFO